MAIGALGEFVDQRRPAWDRLASIVGRSGQTGNVSRLNRDDLKQLGPLYRRAASDLAYVRLRNADPALIAYLNDLVTHAHGMLYAEPGPGALRLWHFVAFGFPRLLRARRLYVLLAAAMMLGGAAVAAVVVAVDPQNVYVVVPAQFADNDDYYAERQKNPSYNAPDELKPAFAAGLMTNNIGVAIRAFAFGMLGGFPTLYLLFENGLPLGGLAMQQHLHGRDVLFWSLILPHGIMELTAIIISGAAGMLIGHAVVAPGSRSRRDAITLAGRDALRLLLGTVPLFVAAGFTESFITPSALPAGIKLAYAALTAVVLTAYFNARPRAAA
jgi:uncharacterized membrane protein SpoIIM required for sporulation